MEQSGFTQLLNDDSDLRGGCVAIMGAGGKTSLLYHLGGELSQVYPRVLLTSLTQSEFPAHLNVSLMSEGAEKELPDIFERERPIFLMDTEISSSKLAGLSVGQLDRVRRGADICAFECDGARGLSLKVHHDRDPEIPAFATHAIIVVGADVVDTTLTGEKVHRPEVFQKHWNIQKDKILDAAFVAMVVTSRHGYLSKIPAGIKPVYYVNKADTHAGQAEQLAREIRSAGAPTFVGSNHTGICRPVD